MASDFFCKVVLQPENEVRCANCLAHHIEYFTYELIDLDDENNRFVGKFNLKSTNRKGIYLLEVPYHGSVVTYELVVTERCY